MDIDGEPWLNPPSIGCDEFYPGATGTLAVAISADYLEVAPGFVLTFTGQITGRAGANVWDFGDGTVVSNQIFNVQHSWTTPGDYPVVFTAFNDDNPGGISATTMVHVAVQLIYYVDAAGTNPVAPYISWDTAATNIQDAVNAATPAPTSLVLVTNGTYSAGARVTADSATNRVVVTKPVVVQSVNGPASAVIDGTMAARCIYLGPGAQLSGFTLANGYSIVDAGGVYCQDATAIVTNCLLTGNYASGNGGGISGGTIFNSTLTNNSAGNNGGGAQSATLNHCTLTGNSAVNDVNANGGGANASVLNNCTLTGNWAGDSGFGPAFSGPQPAFVVSYFGGGAEGSTLNNCTLIGNQCYGGGGGADSSMLNDCIVADNSAGYGGGVENCTLDNCTVTGNSGSEGINIGGAQDSTLNNSIVYYNTNGGDYGNSTLNYCCTATDPGGTGNITNEPAFVDLAGGDYHLQAGSPCINAGNNSLVTTTNDLDGNPRIQGLVVDMGAYEFPIAAAMAADYTNVAVGFTVKFNWQVFAGNVSQTILDFGDGTVLTNPPAAAHSWAAPGDYLVTFTAFSDQYPAGVSTSVTVHVFEGIYFVSLDCTNPVAPYNSWDTAATNIQDAVDAAVAGGTVLVSNGVYQTGMETADGSTSNRVTVTEPLTLRSINGPAQTAIDGGGTVRCVYLADSDLLDGFTLQNGNIPGGGGGVAGGSTNNVLTNCVLTGDSAYYGGGAFQAVLNNCSLLNNSAGTGGGASTCILNQCTLAGNIAGFGGGRGGGADSSTLNNCVLTNNYSGGYGGGGASSSVLNHCTLSGNSVDSEGGGALGCTLNDCVISANGAAEEGGGMGECTASNCTITKNSSSGASYSTLTNCIVSGNSGSGAYYSTLNNCAVTANTGDTGAGAEACALNNCTLTLNTAFTSGGGADSSTLNNCIVYYNSAPSGANYSGSTLNFSCTTPLPDNSTNNITSAPQLTDTMHISATSPCIGTGSANYSSGMDIDGQPWLNPPSIGCDEFYPGTVGDLAVAITASYTNVVRNFSVMLNGTVTGHASLNVWTFDDGSTVSNQLSVARSWPAAGDYPVTLTAYNDDNPGGVSTTVTVHVIEGIYYVSRNNPNPVPPFDSWNTAATNLQDAADAISVPSGAVILVTNGIYDAGGAVVFGSMTNRLAVTVPATVISVNGPSVTVIQGTPTNGDNAVRCAYLANGVILSGFTLTQGATRTAGDSNQEQSGGGVWCESTNVVVSNCVITGNSANLSGGGDLSGMLNNCILSSNNVPLTFQAVSSWQIVAQGSGGGAQNALLNHCLLVGNFAGDAGGGADGGVLNDCVLAGNSVNDSGGAAASATLNDCAVTNNAAGYGGGGVEACALVGCAVDGNASFYGGGASDSTLTNCTILANSGNTGAGALNSILVNCALSGNYTYDSESPGTGGGAEDCTLNNCTLTFNSATVGGGADNSTLNNSIVYYNTAPNGTNFSNSTLNYSCTTPLPDNGTNNITSMPGLADAFHLGASSPCLGAGSAIFTSGMDIDGEAWLNPPSIGCDEFYPGTAAGLLSASIQGEIYVPTGFEDNFTATIGGHASANSWNFGDGNVVSNAPLIAHAWTTPGDYSVVFSVFNNDNPAGINATLTVRVVSQLVYYVNASGTNPVAPYLSWDTAATNLQSALDAALAPGSLVLVSNGVYAPASVNSATVIQGVGGPAVTIINGMNTSPCLYLASNSVLSGFTLTNGNAYWSGGGVTCQSTNVLITNCVISGNSAGYGAGGVAGGTLENCLITGNSTAFGGGANSSILINCIIANNSAYTGAGADGCTLENCTVTGNTSSGGGGFQGGGGLHGCVAVNCNIYGNGAIFGGGASDSTLTFCNVSNNDGWNYGGGAINSALNNCSVIGNVGAISGGGAESSIMNNCLVAGNTAWDNFGAADSSALTNCTIVGNSCFYNNLGGVGSCTLANCIVYDNAGINFSSSTLNYCCTTPLPAGTGNFTNDPAFLNLAGGDYHLQTNSPCINSGNNSLVTTTNDLDNNSRIAGGTVDIGAYEFQTPVSAISYAWLAQYGLPADPSSDYADADGDGMNNWQEWRAGTNPTNALSVLKMVAPASANNFSGITVTWQSVSGVNYLLQRSTDLSAPFTIIQSNLPGQPVTTSFTDTTATNAGPYFYRVGVP